MTLHETPSIPTGRLDGQRFFRVADRDFHYLMDEPSQGYSGDRQTAWFRAVQHAVEVGETSVEERTNQRLNDYVGSGVYGLCLLGGEVTSNRLSGEWRVGESVLLATYEVA